MTSRERFTRMYEHREADRVPIIIDSPWPVTLERWRKEGMPSNVDFVDFFGMDHVRHIGVDISPRYEEKVLEETDEYVITTTKWGVTVKNWKHAESTPEFLNYTVVDPDTWLKAKKRMVPTPDRIPWERLKEKYHEWKKKDEWIQAGLWFGFDVTHSWVVGTERVLVALIENPEWCMDMFNHFLYMGITLLDMVWEAGYKFDEVSWPDDMGYKNTQFFSVQLYREVLKPFHQRAIEWAHSHGVKAHLHSCGNINPFVPELIEIGLDALNPIEVKAGMNPIQLKRDYGNNLVFHGGLNAALWDKPEKLFEEMQNVIPAMKQNGGYIVSTDHSVPSCVSLKDFKRFVELAKELGSY